MMELLLKNGADVNIANAQNQSPLHAVLQSSSGYTRARTICETQKAPWPAGCADR